MARRNALIAALLLAVLLAHALMLQWLAWQSQDPSSLRLMTAPMLTRLLQQQAPAPVAAVVAPTPKPRRRPPGLIEPVVPSVPAEATVTAAPPQPEPKPEPPAELAASEPPTATPSAATTAEAKEVALPQPTATSGVPAGTDTVGVTADGWPIDTRLTYRVGGYYRGDLTGSARVEWLRQGDRYQTRIDIDLGLVSMVMTSQGQVREKELLPSAYEEAWLGKRRTVQIEDRIVLSDGSKVDKPDSVQDTASQFVELSHRFAAGLAPLEVGRSVTFSLARPGGVDSWTYDIVGKESLQTPFLGAVEAFHLKPRPIVNPRGNITAEIWFAPSLQYLPVRIRVTSGDANLDLAIDKIEQR